MTTTLNGQTTSGVDDEELSEWGESFDQLLAVRGPGRAAEVLQMLGRRAAIAGLGGPEAVTTDYVNTIPPSAEPAFPGDEDIERSYRRLLRWNAAVLVQRAQRPDIGVGGHISTYAGAATLYEVGLNHFFRGPEHPGGGDQVFFQGHASPGMYARAYLEGRLSEADLDGFRQEKSKAPHGLPSYPHPRMLPDFWQFPTVSMGLGPMNAIYQAQFNRYLAAPRHQGHLRPARLGVPRRRGDGRAGVARVPPACRQRRPGQPRLRHQLQPAAARRAGPRQRQDRAGARGLLPRGRLERRQGPLGP